MIPRLITASRSKGSLNMDPIYTKRYYAAAPAGKPAAKGPPAGKGGPPGSGAPLPTHFGYAPLPRKGRVADAEGYFTVPFDLPAPDRARLRVMVPSGEASSAPPLGVVLGMYQIPLMDFTREFNSRTADFEKGIPFNVKILKNGKSVSFVIKGPTTSSLFDQVVEGAYEEIDVCKLWDVVKIKQHFVTKVEKTNDIKATARTVLGSLRSLKTKITGLPVPEAELKPVPKRKKSKFYDDEDDPDMTNPNTDEEELETASNNTYTRVIDPGR